MCSRVSEEEIEKVASELDPQSRCLLLHVWEQRHATIQDLSGLYDAPNHMDVLQRIRDIINPLSETIVGFPILVFERSKSDPLTGEKVLFSWWILGDRGAREELLEPLIDLFEEEDHIIFLMEVKGIEEENIQVTISGNHLNILCDSPALPYSEDVLLPATVDPDTARKRYNNGILEIKVQKRLMGRKSIPEEWEPAPEFNSGLNS